MMMLMGRAATAMNHSSHVICRAATVPALRNCHSTDDVDEADDEDAAPPSPPLLLSSFARTPAPFPQVGIKQAYVPAVSSTHLAYKKVKFAKKSDNNIELHLQHVEIEP
ncbi:hypothetical protein PRIPAC_71746 [Pristionchus pacificus]|uniref:Uncharacterized protein n=1 Tax=Pristionchus pacificus TaxID=54126 RepID=A0A2A6CFD3_PRIPA|nr:hypothetical protein PRIPAC_71746 [Pristionchus pacificus]|eukprot:PDM76826.1 hypothetical protein PRIPAC_42221 [Pristionchus pacificus]